MLSCLSDLYGEASLFNSTASPRLDFVRVKISLIQELFHRAIRRDESGMNSRRGLELSTSPQEDKGDQTNITAAPAAEKESSKTNSNAGQITNLWSYDVDAIVAARDIVISCVGGPIELVIAMTLLYRMLGWPSLVEQAVMLLCLPIPTYLARKMSHTHTCAMKATDTRISRIAECLPATRTIKYFTWGKAIYERIDEARVSEQALMWKRSLCATGITSCASAIPQLTLLVMF